MRVCGFAGMRVQHALLAKFGMPGDNRMRHQHGSGTDTGVGADMAEWAHANPVAEFGAILDAGGGMNFHGQFVPVSCRRPVAAYPFFFGFEFFCNQATSRIHCRMGLAGVPPQVSPASTSRNNPADAARETPSPTFT